MNILAIWVVGIVLTIRCAWEIGCLRIPKEKKLMAILLVVLTSWKGRSMARQVMTKTKLVRYSGV